MNSLEWRTKKLENQILGQQQKSAAHIDRILSQTGNQASILNQLHSVTKQYRSFLDTIGKNYPKFNELYNKNQQLFNDLEANIDADVSSKAELALAYEDDLIKYAKNLEDVVKKADRVLRIDKWPDLSGVNGKLEQLQTITKDQHLQSTTMDRRSEELIDIYNDIIGSFKSNMVIWNQKLEVYENEDKKPDEEGGD